MNNERDYNELHSLQRIIEMLQPLERTDRERLLDTVCRFFDLPSISPKGSMAVSTEPPGRSSRAVAYTTDLSLSAKEFMLEKQPDTAVEKIACLAYYLAHYLDTPQFKTIDLSRLNTEAAQPKFSNASYAANDAVKSNILIPTTKGNRQLSAIGEKFVEALPDREAARAVLSQAKPKRKSRRKAGS